MSVQAALPLFDLFTELRERSFPLGAGDYLAGLKALADGVGADSREDLIFMCGVMWGKTRDEQRQIKQILMSLLPAQFTAADLEALAARESGAASTAPPPPPPADLPPPKLPEPHGRAKPSPRPGPPPPAASKDAPPAAVRGAGGGRTTAALTGARVPFDAPWAEGAGWRLDPRLDLIGTLPVTRRQVKTAWRYFRRMQRRGAPTELDVAATVERAYRQGVVLRPVLIPRRVNLARLLILADEGGSMIPFRRVTGPLLETARQSGFARFAVYFFHDVAARHVFRDPLLNDPVPFNVAAEGFQGAGVLVVGDAGAARGLLDARRVRSSARFVAALRQLTPNLAWVNPVPRERWAGTTAEAVRRESGVPMFPLDREGMYAAVERLRGR